ncbi:MAG: hypothetical protein HZB16_13265 [Armatimonadetes bacterium]|nr:hypothetical protein [Armatimonadota bacterium]
MLRCLLLSLLTATLTVATPLAARLEGADGRWAAPSAELRVPAPDQHSVTLSFRLRAPGETITPMDRRGDDPWYGSGWWSGPEWCRVGRDWQHPGERTGSIRCWRAPRDGHVTLTGRVRKLHLDGDGVRVSIRAGGRELWQAELEGKDGQGVEPKLALDLKRGDALRFIVERRGTHFCDTTGWDPGIAYDDGETFLASKAWGPEQGTQGWSYEVLGDPDQSEPRPMLTGVDNGLSLRRAALSDGQTIAWAGSELLPAWLLSDGDRSGLVLVPEPASVCGLSVDAGADGLLRLTVTSAGRLDAVRARSYEAAQATGLMLLADELSPHARATLDALSGGLARRPDLPMLLLAQAEWRREDKLAESTASYAAAIADHGRRLAALGVKAPTPAANELDALRETYLKTRLLKRDRLLAKALPAAAQLLFCRRAQPSYAHLVGQYFGWRQRPGGGLYVLEQPGVSLRTRDVLGHQLPAGSVLEPSLSFDGQRIAFSYVATPSRPLISTELPVNEEGGNEGYFHLYEIGVDGTGLRQRTDGRYDDMMPCWLPDGGLAFVSTRRQSYSRCFGTNFSRRWHSYTLHRLDPGGEPRILSMNDVSEWFPALGNDGRLLFARWDYIDRDAVTHQNLWASRPDGTNPVAIWGNASPKPHCTFQAKAIPGSQKIAFIASAHHSITAGPLCVLDPTVDANSQDAIRRVTPGPLPEAEDNSIGEYYNAPWPLSEDLFLVAYSPERLIFEGEHLSTPNPDYALGLYVLDSAGNRELLYRDGQLGATNPMPLAARPAPPNLPAQLVPAGATSGEMLLTDVYQGLGNVPRGSITALRVVEILPKTSWLANDPRIGIAGEENARTILGTVPVDADGSARFELPAHRAVLFQALDREGNAYQTMRSITWVQPGEKTACVGCHERPLTASRASRPGVPLALTRPASQLDPGTLGGEPFSYAKLVQPILDKRCGSCHAGAEAEAKAGLVLTGEPKDGLSASYLALCDDKAGLVPRFPQRNQVQITPPGGQTGALGSRLMKLLRDGHHEVRLSDDERRTLAAWIDLNAVYRGDYGSSQ